MAQEPGSEETEETEEKSCINGNCDGELVGSYGGVTCTGCGYSTDC